MSRKRIPGSNRIRSIIPPQVTIESRNHYLGPYGSSESCEQYARLIAEWKSGALVTGTKPRKAEYELTIVELLAAFWKYAERRYIKKGKPPSEQPTRVGSMPGNDIVCRHNNYLL